MIRSSVLIVSHSPALTTGYGRVVREIAAGLTSAGYGVTVLGMGYAGGPHDFPYRIVPWVAQDPAAAPADTPGAGTGTAAQAAAMASLGVASSSPPSLPASAVPGSIAGLTLAQALERFGPDLLITVGDPWMFEGLERLPQRRDCKWLAYFPVDGQPLPRRWGQWVKDVDVPVVFCRFTQRVVQEATGIAPRIIPHGVDTRVFAPADKALARRRVGVEGFVVGCVAANQPRKNLPALIKAFAIFAQDKPDAMLYLHTRIDGYWDIEELVLRFGVEPRTRATLNLDPLRGVSDEVLATLYNSFDLFVLPSAAEGFGLPILESQACGVPALVTDYSASPELVPDALQRVPVKHTIILARNFEQALIDEQELASRMTQLYRDRGLLNELGIAGLALARTLDWGSIRQRFVELVADVLGAPASPK